MSTFSESFRETTGVSWWLPVLVLVLVGMAYRLYRALTGERREGKRRHKIIADLNEFIGGATRANKEEAQRLYREKMQKHAELYVHRMPIRELLEVNGIGRASVQAMEDAGYHTLGQVARGNIRAIHRVGLVKADAAARHIYNHIDYAFRQLMDNPDALPKDPRIEAQYNAALDLLRIQNDVLQGDREGLQPVVEDIHEYEKAVAARDTKERFREWLRSPIEAVRTEPTRPLRFLVVSVLFITVTVAIPLLLAGTRSSGVTAAMYAGYVSSIFLYVVYVFISDRGVKLGSKPLDPANFQEQRLQFFGLQMALRRGVAPPEVRITDAAAPSTTGHRAGPSLIALPRLEVNRLARSRKQEGVEFMLAHEVGRLSGDHQRLATTAEALIAPFGWLARQMRAVIGTVARGLRDFNEPGCVGVFTMLAFMLFIALLAPFALLATLLHWAVATVRVVLSASAVYSADRVGRDLTSSEAMTAALEDLEHSGRVDRDRAAMQQDAVMGMDLLVAPEPTDPGSRMTRFTNWLTEKLTRAEPNRTRRLRAIGSTAAPALDVGAGVLRALAVLAVAMVAFWLTGGVFDGLLGGSRRPAVTYAAPTPPPPPAPVAAPADPVVHRYRVRVRGEASSCSIRAEASTESRVVGRAMHDSICTGQPEGTDWHSVVCGQRSGFVGAGCLVEEP